MGDYDKDNVPSMGFVNIHAAAVAVPAAAKLFQGMFVMSNCIRLCLVIWKKRKKKKKEKRSNKIVCLILIYFIRWDKIDADLKLTAFCKADKTEYSILDKQMQQRQHRQTNKYSIATNSTTMMMDYN
jgi:hypothetical protein